ncbi:MAG TPA: TolC family protein [Phycisphaerae bacterium]|nr:TolC family protein [Phycisphaerae bacterium]
MHPRWNSVWTRGLGGRLLCAVLAAPLALTGCVGRESLYRAVRARRSLAYQEWRRGRERPAEHEPTVKGKLSLQDAIKLALVHSKPLQAAVVGKEIARGRIVESYSEALPKVSLLGSYGRSDRVGGFHVGGQSVSIGELDNYSADLVIRQPLFRGGAIGAAIRAAELFAAMTDEAVRGQVQQTIHEVATVYYDLLLARRLFEANEQAVASAEAQLRDVQGKQREGTASKYDVLRAEVDVSNFRAEMIRQRNAIHLARTRLLKAMGVSQDSRVTCSDALAYHPIKPVLEEAVRIASKNRPDLYQAELSVRLQHQAVRLAESRYFPQVDATFNYGWMRPDPHAATLDRWDDRWTAGVTVEIPLFDGLKREGRLIQEKAALRRSKIRLRDTEERALLEIQQSLLSLRDAEELVDSQRLNLKRASEGLRLAGVNYREGISTVVEVTDARSALTRARSLHYQAIYAHTLARLALQRSMGILGPRAPGAAPGRFRVRPGRIDEFEPADRKGDKGPSSRPSTRPAASQPARGKENRNR